MMNEHLKLLELAVNNALPDTIDKETGLPLNIVRELLDAGYLTAMDTGEFGEDAYMSPRITMSGREYLQHLKSDERSDVNNMVTSPIRLFISHSAADRDLVERLVKLLRAALVLPASQIRCTSVDGYRLPAGVDTAEQLRLEVHEATVLVGVISASSLRSLYVAFELGARWGAKRPLFPLLAPGTNASILEGPLAGLNALSSASSAQLHQLISDLSTVLGIKSEEPAVYQQYVEEVLALSKAAPNLSDPDDRGSGKTIASLPPKCVEVMQVIAAKGDYNVTVEDIARLLKENQTKAQYYLDQLLAADLIHDALSYAEPTTYGLNIAGRAYLVEQGLV
jgi:hypothetical protein